MNKHELIYLAEKYAAKKANSQERLAVDIFLRKVQEQGTHPFVNLDEEKRNKLFSKIEDKIQFNNNEEKNYWKRIIASAAVLFLLMGTVLLSLIIENNITHKGNRLVDLATKCFIKNYKILQTSENSNRGNLSSNLVSSP